MAYQKQIWENLPSQNTPVNADRLNHMEDGIYKASTGTSIEVHNEYSTSTTEPYSANYVNALNGKILWVNPSPSSTFGPQNITLSSDDYDCLEIYYYDWIDTKRMKSQRAIKGENILIDASFFSDPNFFASGRPITYNSDTSYSVGDCVALYGSTTTLVNQSINFVCIPVYIIGYKTELF